MMDHVMVGHHTGTKRAMQPTFTTRPDIRGTFGAVASTHWLATQTGMAVLERGGNAFDAAVAAGFVLQIVEQYEAGRNRGVERSEEHTSELQSPCNLVC